jgi:hypothetical protein
MEIHIGKVIKARLLETGMSKSEFARRINKTSQNVYDIFDRKTIDTGLLVIISSVLEFNFFEAYSTNVVLYLTKAVSLVAEETPPCSFGDVINSLMQLENKMKTQNLEITALKKEIAYLMEINGLLSGRNKLK